jgi:apolipoprotein N-acyltransferase
MSSIFWGILHAWSVATPWDGQTVWWLQLLAMTWLVRRTHLSLTIKNAITVTFPFAIAWFASSMWWLYTSMHDYGGLAAPLATLAVLALSALLASFYVAACAVYGQLKTDKPRFNAVLNALLFAALWLLAELLRGTVMSGLPWSAVGYAHVDSPLAALVPYVGVYGISFVAAFIAALFVLTRSCLLKIAIVAVLLIRASLVPQVAPQAAPTLPSQGTPSASLTVRLLQGNIPQNEKFDPSTGVDVALRWYKMELLKAAADGVDLVVAPETAIPLLPQQLPVDYWPALHDAFAGQNKTAALIGMPLGGSGNNYSNSSLGLLPGLGAAPYRYDKHHLVPFGEFVPPAFRWFIDLMRIPLGDFARGDLAQPSMLHKGWRLAPNICYEDLFGEELATRFTDPATTPSVFVNLSNMGWFAKPGANSLAIDQHLSIARMRTLEFDRPMIRATNTGATVIINRKGVVTHSLARGTRGVLNGTLEGGVSTITPYAMWAAQYGLKPLWLLAFALITILFLKRKYEFPRSRE